MAWVYPLLDMLADGRPSWLVDHASVDPALGVAMATAGGAGRRRLIDTILKRNNAQGLRALLIRYHELQPADQQALRERMDQLYRPIRQVLGLSEPRPVLNALELIESAREAKLAYLVTDRLRHGDEQVRERAARCLLHLAMGADEMEPTELPDLCGAIESAVDRYELHENPAVLRALLCLTPRSMPKAYAALADAQHGAVGPMRRLLSAADGPGVRRGLLMMLSFPTLAGAASSGLRVCRDEGTLAEVLSGGEHLLSLATVRRGLARCGQSTGYEPTPQVLGSWSDGARRGWAAMVAALPWSVQAKLERLATLLADPHPEVRLEALQHVLEIADVGEGLELTDRDRAEVLITEVAGDVEPCVARVAAAWALGRRDIATQQLAAMSNSAQPVIRGWAQRRLGPAAFDRLWHSWPKLDVAARSAAAKAVMKLDPDTKIRLQERLVADKLQRERATQILAVLPEELMDDAQDAMPSVTWRTAGAMMPFMMWCFGASTLAVDEASSDKLFNGDPSDVGKYAMDGSQMQSQWIVPIIGGFMVLFSVISLVSFWRQQKTNPHSLTVFNRLAREMGLTWGDRLTLWRISRGARLDSPLALMLCPETLHSLARDYVGTLGRNQAAAVLQRAASIRRRLFS